MNYDQITLSAPWTGATGKAMLTFHHNHYNYAVHFAMPYLDAGRAPAPATTG